MNENERIPLTTGKKSNKQIAEWMGIRPQTFSNSKDVYLEKLKRYADYIITDKGKIEILEVKEPYYDSGRATDRVRELIPVYWNKSHYDTSTNVGHKIKKGEEINNPNGPVAKLSEGTIVVYTCKERTSLYGSPNPNKQTFGGGSRGWCRYGWCKEDANGELIPLTPEEDQIRRDVFRQFFGKPEETENRWEFVISELAENDGQLSEEAIETVTGMDKETLKLTWIACRSAVNLALGFKVTQGTYIEDWKVEDKEERKKQIEAAGY